MRSLSCGLSISDLLHRYFRACAASSNPSGSASTSTQAMRAGSVPRLSQAHGAALHHARAGLQMDRGTVTEPQSISPEITIT